VVSLDSIEELRELGERECGAMVTLHQLASDEAWGRRFPALTQAAGGIASAPLRRQATCGGNVMVETRCFWFNQFQAWREAEGYCLKADGDICRVVLQPEICYAMYPGELAPGLLCLDATLHLLGPDGARDVPVREFFQGDGIAKNHARPGEVLVKFSLPAGAEDLVSGYRKLALRSSVDFAEAGVAAAVSLVEGRVARLELACTAVDVVPVYLGDLCRQLEGEAPDAGWYARLQEGVSEGINPVKNTFLSPQYRKRMAGVFARRLVQALVEASA
jgi:4-hydroxybenzoyl-CoA reductase subunit beta